MRDEWKNLISIRKATLFTMGLRRDLVLRNFETSPCRIRPDCACTQWCTDRLRPRRSPRWRGHRDTNGPISSSRTKADEMKKPSFSSFQYLSCFCVGTSPVTKDIWCTYIYIHTYIGICEAQCIDRWWERRVWLGPACPRSGPGVHWVPEITRSSSPYQSLSLVWLFFPNIEFNKSNIQHLRSETMSSPSAMVLQAQEIVLWSCKRSRSKLDIIPGPFQSAETQKGCKNHGNPT